MNEAAKKDHEEHEKNASQLKDGQEMHASLLVQFHKENAADLKHHQEGTAIHDLETTNMNSLTVTESHEQAAVNLAESQREHAMILKENQLRAAEILKETHIRAAEKHKEKDDVISWLTGGYSIQKDE